ncbi:hypothetical protein H6P81_013048 [Aristolochia fimbriata]|uniref:Uncharacterized protein n=1 Tax=Aristolochia fimbriata TaxID=158543 RepID=A0AAV7EFR6_ARIFI|nr:hypothetical protein H6P81_013048 [Aristolochia fimbriata]
MGKKRNGEGTSIPAATDDKQESVSSHSMAEQEQGGSSKDEEEDEEGNEDEDLEEADEDESYLDLARKLLDVARAISEKLPEDSIMKVDILLACGRALSSPVAGVNLENDQGVGVASKVPSLTAILKLKGPTVPRTSSEVWRVLSGAGVDSSTVSTGATSSAGGSTITDLGVVGRGIKRANVRPITAEPPAKNPAVE